METIRPRKLLIDVKETARILCLSERTLRNRIGPKAKNPFPVKPKKIGRKVLFLLEDIEDYVRSL